VPSRAPWTLAARAHVTPAAAAKAKAKTVRMLSDEREGRGETERVSRQTISLLERSMIGSV
jgi:hypothetical protein